MKIFDNPNFNFIKWRWHAIAVSALIVLAGAVMIAVKGMPLGIDFSGGTALVLQFEQAVNEQQVRSALDSIPGDKVVQVIGNANEHQISVRLPQVTTVEQGASLEVGSQQIEQTLQKAGLPKATVVKREIVGPVIGADLQRRGVLATLASILAITVYIAFRFRPSFAIGAIVATLHDVFVTFAFLRFFNYELSLNVVAAILTITGYSVNDTIVIFDRVRENMRGSRRDSLEAQVNHAVNQTLGRTIITAGTAFLSVLALYLFGGEALSGFSFTMLVGIVSGTYSTVFIASAIAIILSQKRAVAVAPPAAAVTAGRNRKPKGAKAS
jgi:preprotein translocase subunit SecF